MSKFEFFASICGPFYKNCEKIAKSAILEVEKPLEMGPNLRKILKKVKSAVFWGEQNP